jgi:hypothetical protein
MVKAMEGTSQKADIIATRLKANTGLLGNDLDVGEESVSGNPAPLYPFNHSGANLAFLWDLDVARYVRLH